MGGRELVILLLGLAIVAVVLRGLYVALQGRRGQIRMAIDKNIPQNIDLESLELAELPGGGARVVDRSLQEVNRQNSALDSAQVRAEALDLGEVSGSDSHIPVLMDAVELGAVKVDIPAEESSSEPEWQDTDVATEESEEYLEEEDYESDRVAVPPISESHLEDEFDEAAEDDDPDSVLFDYDEDEGDEDEIAESSYSESAQDEVSQDIDPLKAVAPDYEQETEESEDQYSNYEEEDESLLEDDEHDAVADPLEDDEYEESANTDPDTDTEEAEQPVFDPTNELDDFSMTAGERIGFNAQALEESGLFDEEDEAPAEAVKPKRRSLFSFFERKPKLPEAVEEVRPEPEAAPEPEPVPQPEIQEPVGVTESLPFADEEIVEPVDELEQVRAAQAPEPVQESMEPSEVIVINVMARNGRVFAGDDLLHLLITSGLKFGDMNIFHKRLSNDSQGAIIFSVANILNPGTFDLNNMEEFTTLGISLFLALPSPINNLDAFEQMLDVAQQIRGTLDGELKDDHRNGMTAQTIEHYRQRIRDFELLRLKTAGARA